MQTTQPIRGGTTRFPNRRTSSFSSFFELSSTCSQSYGCACVTESRSTIEAINLDVTMSTHSSTSLRQLKTVSKRGGDMSLKRNANIASRKKAATNSALAQPDLSYVPDLGRRTREGGRRSIGHRREEEEVSVRHASMSSPNLGLSVSEDGCDEQNGPGDAFLMEMQKTTAEICGVISVMQSYPHDARIQVLGCGELCKYSKRYGTGGEKNPVFGLAEGIGTILTSMRDHPISADVQRYGCECLYNLSKTEWNRYVVVAQGGVKVLVRAISNHGRLFEVRAFGCEALAKVLEVFGERAHFERGGGREAVLMLMRMFPTDDAVLKSVFKILRNLGCNPNATLLEWSEVEDRSSSRTSAVPQQGVKWSSTPNDVFPYSEGEEDISITGGTQKSRSNLGDLVRELDALSPRRWGQDEGTAEEVEQSITWSLTPSDVCSSAGGTPTSHATLKNADNGFGRAPPQRRFHDEERLSHSIAIPMERGVDSIHSREAALPSLDGTEETLASGFFSEPYSDTLKYSDFAEPYLDSLED